MAARTSFMWLGAAILTAAVASTSGIASAQQAPANPGRAVPMQEDGIRADIDFRGGTLAEYIEVVEKAFGASNAAVQQGAESVRLAPARFVGVRRQDALFVVMALADPRDSRRLIVGSIGTPPITQITADEKFATRPAELRVWTLDALVEGGASVEDILSAIEVAVTLIPSEPQIKFHKDTGLLIMRAQIEQLDAANQVLKALELAQHQAADAAKRKAEDAAKQAASSN